MSKKVNSDLEKMNRDKRKAEAEYAEHRDTVLEVRRIMREGIGCIEELVLYLDAAIQDSKHFEDLARAGNNSIMYSEAVGIKREFEKLLNLILMDGTAQEKIMEETDGTEEKHRANNGGEEAYA